MIHNVAVAIIFIVV